LKSGFAEAPSIFGLSARQIEIGAYEALWLEDGATFRTISQRVAASPGGMPAALVEPERAKACARDAAARFGRAGLGDVETHLLGAPGYPAKLCDARYPLPAFYYRGDWSLVDTPTVAVVGARQLSEKGIARTQRLVRYLVEDGFTIVSGLAAGTDRVAHTSALEMGGRTIAVLGTPIHKTYPRENAALQRQIAERFLVISQVPVLHYDAKDWRSNRKFFPERNITMSALTDASIIVEIGESRGTYIQSKVALDQGRPLFLLNNCFEKTDINWPSRFEARGAVRVRDYEDIRSRIGHFGT
jgi:DNA processing protein